MNIPFTEPFIDVDRIKYCCDGFLNQGVNKNAEVKSKFTGEPSKEFSLPTESTNLLPDPKKTTIQPKMRRYQKHLINKSSCRQNKTGIQNIRVKKKEVEKPQILTINTVSTEDTYFALSLVGCLQRLEPKKKAIAKVGIVKYLASMEHF